MPAVRDRRSRDRRGRIASICGRRHCSHCSRWLLITEFGVERWADAAKTEVSHLKRDCRSCRSRQAREGRARHETLRRSNAEACLRWRRAQKAKKAKQAAPLLPDFYRVDRVIDSLDRDQLRQYNLENCLSIVPHHGVSLADEDYDPTPVPTGCAGCWRKDGSEPCMRCPSPPSRQERRDRGSYRVALLA